MAWRIFKTFALALLFAAAAVWLSKNGGRVEIIWLGYKMSSTAPVFVCLVLLSVWALGRISACVRLLVGMASGRRKSENAKIPFIGSTP